MKTPRQSDNRDEPNPCNHEHAEHMGDRDPRRWLCTDCGEPFIGDAPVDEGDVGEQV